MKLTGKLKTKAYYVGGRFLRSRQNEAEICVRDPGDLARITWNIATHREMIDRAVEAAVKALDRFDAAPRSGDWAALLRKLKAQMLNRRQELARAIATATGRPLWDARLEVRLSSVLVGEAADRPPPPAVSDDRYHGRVPLGVLALLSAADLPLIQPLSVLLEALPAGNGVILLPPAHCGPVGFLLAELLHECDLSSGAFALVHGEDEAAQYLTEHPGVNRALPPVASGPPEGGATDNDALVRAGDDLERAARATAIGAFLCSGQRRDSLKRIFVEHLAADEFCDTLVRVTRGLDLGHPLGDGTVAFFGPMATAPGRAALVDFAERGPGEAVLEGGVLDRPPAGLWVQPAIRRIGRDEARPSRVPQGPAVLLLDVERAGQAITAGRLQPELRTFTFLGREPENKFWTRTVNARFVGFGITSPGDWLRRAEAGEISLPWERPYATTPVSRPVRIAEDPRDDPAAGLPGFGKKDAR